MVVNKNENIDPYDVDGTLIIHQDVSTIPEGEKVRVCDPISSEYISVRINRPMVRLLMESKARGFYVRVWSRGGWEWALEVIKALKLEEYVDSVESKPRAYFDDTPVEKWLADRVFIGPDVIYKINNLKKEK